MKTSSAYITVASNDHLLITAVAMRKAITEIFGHSTLLGPSESGGGHSYVAHISLLRALQAAYFQHLPRKQQDKFHEHRPTNLDVSSVCEFVAVMTKAGIDHVGAARVGISLVTFCCWDALDAQVEVSKKPTVELVNLMSLFNYHHFVTEHLVQYACDHALAAVDPTLGVGRAKYVIGHDLTAPLIVVGPTEAQRLVSQAQIDTQLGPFADEFAMAEAADIADKVLEAQIARLTSAG